jgi:hypothetical protein
MEFTSELLQALSKRAWKLSWIFIVYILFALCVILLIVIHKELYILSNLPTLEDNYVSILSFLWESLIVSVIVFTIFFILKGDSDTTIKKLREKFYNKAIERVRLVFEYRYDFPDSLYTKEIKELTQYTKKFKKDSNLHTINIDNLNTYIVDGIDSLYITYTINQTEKILFSIWHSGTFIAIAVAIDHKILPATEKEINTKFENTLNLSGSENEANRLSLRDGYWWFDIKYLTNEEFLFNNIDQEQISRKVAHIVTVGLTSSMELLQWNKIK